MLLRHLFWLLLAGGCTSPAEHGGSALVSDEPGGDGPQAAAPSGWLSWRGPQQDGTSRETGLPERLALDDESLLWSVELAGRGTPAVAGSRVYAFGYAGKGKDLQEVLACLDARTGERLWEQRFNDFLTDSVYDRYSIGAPTVDPETGNVFLVSTAGVVLAFTQDGQPIWERSLMDELGRLTFPNGRTGAPVVDGELVILHVISASWGPLGPARDRFYAFDKRTGESLWVATPGESPQDSSFSFPVLEWRNGRRVLYAGTGCGHVVALDARTGDVLWRFLLSANGVNAAPVLHGDSLIAIHGKENVDSITTGRMVSLRLGAEPAPGASGILTLGPDHEEWRADLVAFTSSPALVGDRVYATVETGELCCVDANDGRILWQEKLAPDQIHASPVWGDGKLYVPMTNGSFYVIRPSDAGPEVLSHVQLAGNCLGAPAIADGKVLVFSTERLYCFGAERGQPVAAPERGAGPAPGAAARLQVVPSDLVLQVGERAVLHARVLDAHGTPLRARTPLSGETPQGGEPPAEVGPAAFTSKLALDIAPVEGTPGAAEIVAKAPGAGLVSAAWGGCAGQARVRIVPALPLREDFEAIQLTEGPENARFAWTPDSWINAKPKWDVRELGGTKVLAKTLTNPLFQRSTCYFGHPGAHGYTLQADLYSDGNRRSMASGGLINQRYQIELKGNHQELEVSSNVERIKESVPFAMKAETWYTLKTRVDVAPDGSGVVRAKAWVRGEPEPEAWTIEVEHRHAHARGAPGIFGFAPQSRFKVYLDNVVVTPNE